MKHLKLTAIILALALALSACGSTTDENAATPPETTTTTAEQELTTASEETTTSEETETSEETTSSGETTAGETTIAEETTSEEETTTEEETETSEEETTAAEETAYTGEETSNPYELYFMFEYDDYVTNKKLAQMIADGTIPKNAQRLTIYENLLTDITPLQELTELTYLYLGSNKISDISPLKSR